MDSEGLFCAFSVIDMDVLPSLQCFFLFLFFFCCCFLFLALSAFYSLLEQKEPKSCLPNYFFAS